MLKIIGATLLVCLCSIGLHAQDSSDVSLFKISGSADMYFRSDWNNPKHITYNNFTSFTQSQNSFELGMASVKLEHAIGKVGMIADLGFGKRAEEFSYNDTRSGVAIKQLLITYAPSSKLKFTAGSFATHIGYELVDAYLNRNYSMSYMFSFGPFFHTGLKADFLLGKKNTLMVGIANQSDLKSASVLPKMVIAQFATTSGDDKLKAWINFQGGKTNDSGRLYQGDLVLNYTLSESLSLGYNGTLQSRETKISGKWESPRMWYGSALYINSDVRQWLGFTLRGEYFNDQKNVLGFGTDIFETTLSANFKIDNLTIIPEIRFESAGTKMYSSHNENMVNKTGNFLVAVVYHF
ncbi:MAG: outer membrane beta-barrel protein [Ginsengibacter sp.]